MDRAAAALVKGLSNNIYLLFGEQQRASPCHFNRTESEVLGARGKMRLHVSRALVSSFLLLVLPLELLEYTHTDTKKKTKREVRKTLLK